MASTKEIKRRIKSVKSTLQITKAMELISSLKMRKAISRANTSRSYSASIWQLICQFSELSEIRNLDLFQIRPLKKILVIVIASDRGLCSNYNSELFRQASQYFMELKAQGINLPSQAEIITVGRKSSRYFSKLGIIPIIASFEKLGDVADYSDTTPITKLALDGFGQKKYDRVVVIYSHFITSLRRQPFIRQVLPIEAGIETCPIPVSEELALTKTEFEFEPTLKEVITNLMPKAIRAQIYQTILEANASEHSARMMAMKNATDAARDLVLDLEFTYNQLRQQSITAEIAEISTGVIAITS